MVRARWRLAPGSTVAGPAYLPGMAERSPPSPLLPSRHLVTLSSLPRSTRRAWWHSPRATVSSPEMVGRLTIAGTLARRSLDSLSPPRASTIVDKSLLFMDSLTGPPASPSPTPSLNRAAYRCSLVDCSRSLSRAAVARSRVQWPLRDAAILDTSRSVGKNLFPASLSLLADLDFFPSHYHQRHQRSNPLSDFDDFTHYFLRLKSQASGY